MTSKQATAYRYVSRMVVAAGGNIHLMRQILEQGDTWKQYAHLLNETAQSFFYNEYSSRQFNETRQQILRRLYQVLENDIFAKMLGSDTNSIDIADAINNGKVVLISTAKDQLKQEGASLLGRIFIAQVMTAVLQRKNYRPRTYLYLDEFQDYAEDSSVMFNLFEQARKYELGLIVAHQYLGQLPPKLQQSIAANTAIKSAGGVSAEDAAKLSRQMHCDAKLLQQAVAGRFYVYVKGGQTTQLDIELGKTWPVVGEISAIREVMQRKYGAKTTPPTLESGREPPEMGEW